MIVYKITNTVNGKCYIGITAKPLQVRWMAHLTQMRQGNKRTLYNALRKYGFKNFAIEQMDCASTVEELSLLEKQYITKFNSFGRVQHLDGVRTIGGRDFEIYIDDGVGVSVNLLDAKPIGLDRPCESD